MNNQNGFTQRLLTIMLLFFLGQFLAQKFGLFGANDQNKSARPARPALTLGQAWTGIAPNTSNPAKVQAEIKQLDAAIAQNNSDEYSYSARLRSGLLQQYFANDSKAALAHYNEIIKHAGTDAITAQATYQKGDLLWNQAVKAGDIANGVVQTATPTVEDAAKTLEQLVHKGRGSSAFLDLQIYVPRSPATTGSVPDFQLMRVGELRGTLDKPNPEGIPDRVNAYYQTTVFFKVFDAVVHLFGANPAYSYGLAILFFAVFTRLLMQPLNKKQYESMKGLQVIAPEMKKIQEKYKGKPEQQMQMVKETRELQAAHGVSPMMGCGLALVQLPIFFVIVYPLIQHYEAKLELAGASFLWIQNLARPDIALLIIYGLSQFLSFRLSATPPTDPQQAQVQATMGFLMPLTIPFFLHTYPSAFPLYWMTFNVLSTVFQYRMMKAADPQKNLIKTLVGKTPAPEAASASVAAIPPRPQSAIKGNKGVSSDAAQDSSTHAAPNRTQSRRESASKTRLNGMSAQAAAEDQAAEDADVDDPISQDEIATSVRNGNGAASNGATLNGSSNGVSSNGAARGSGASDGSRRARQRRRH